MGYYGTPDVYYNPEEFGLKQLLHIDVGGSYEFDMFTVWYDENGKLYWAADSGCSCPSPYEDYTSLDKLDTGTRRDAIEALNAWASQQYSDTSSERADGVAKLSLFDPYNL